MTPFCVEIGLRYGDDSGWERRIKLDTQAERIEIEIGGSEMSIKTSELDWLITALQTAKESGAASTSSASKERT